MVFFLQVQATVVAAAMFLLTAVVLLLHVYRDGCAVRVSLLESHAVISHNHRNQSEFLLSESSSMSTKDSIVPQELQQASRAAVTVLFAQGNRVSWGESVGEILDGACVLSHTMNKFRPRAMRTIDFFLLVEKASDVSASMRSSLSRCGYQVREAVSASALPTLSSSGKMSSEKKSVVAGRAVGIVELLKLDALLMPEYDVVLSLDADIMFTGSYDDLVAPYHDAPYRLSYDFNGGMVVYYPKNDGPKHYRRLLHHFVHTPWTPSGGYAGTGLGEEIAAIGFSGGPMLQGLLPFYLQYDLRVNPRLPRHGIPPCKHNFYLAAESEQFCNDYRGPIHSVHFKGSNFPKPWECDALEKVQDRCQVLSTSAMREAKVNMLRIAVHDVVAEDRCSFLQTRFVLEHRQMLDRWFHIRTKKRSGCHAYAKDLNVLLRDAATEEKGPRQDGSVESLALTSKSEQSNVAAGDDGGVPTQRNGSGNRKWYFYGIDAALRQNAAARENEAKGSTNLSRPQRDSLRSDRVVVGGYGPAALGNTTQHHPPPGKFVKASQPLRVLARGGR